MGNCAFKGSFDHTTSLDPIRVITPSGHVLEFPGPKRAAELLNNFPKHAIFRKDRLLSPLHPQELLLSGQFYHLFPLALDEREHEHEHEQEHKASAYSAPSEPVRMSTSAVALQLVTKNVSDGSGFEVLPAPRKGVWKVKLVIDTKQLVEILSEEVNTEALIEQMRAAATRPVTVVPRRSRSYWRVKLKPILCSAVNRTVVDDSSSPKCVTPMLELE